MMLAVVGSVIFVAQISAEAEIAHGVSGTCSWIIDDNGLLTIYPTDGVSGVLADVAPNTYNGPWSNYKDDILGVFVEQGVKTGTSAHHLFYSFRNCVDMNVLNLDTSSAVDMSYMFDNCDSLVELDLSGFDTSNVVNMKWLAGGCSELVYVDISSFDTSNCIDMNAFFGNDHKILSVKVGAGLVPGGNNIGGLPSDLGTKWFDLPYPSTRDGLYTMKWIRDDGIYGPYTQSEFALNYVPDMAGTWVYELDQAPYAVFDETDKTLYFVREQASYDEGSVETVHSISGNDYTGTVFFVNEKSGRRTWASIASRVLHVKFVDRISSNSVYEWFYSFSNCIDFDLAQLDVSNTISMEYMFRYCRSVVSLDLSHFDTSNVTNMSYMFSDCSSLLSLNLSDFNTINVVNMRNMFSSCSSLVSIDVSGFNTSGVTDLRSVFANCFSLSSLDLSSFDTHAAIRMDSFFNNCSSLHSITLGSSFVFNGNNISQVSRRCIFPTPSDVRYSGNWLSFDGVYGPYTPADLRDLYTSDMAGIWVCEIADNPYAVFDDVNNVLYFVRVRDIVPDNLRCVMHSISGSSYEGVVFNVDELSSTINRTWESIAVSVERVVFVDEIHPKNVSLWFRDFSKCTSFDVDNLIVSDVVYMIDMFNGCSSLVTLDLHCFDTGSVISFCRMFSGCESLVSLNLDGFDTSAALNMENMFNDCVSLLELDISSFDTSSVTAMGSMFVGYYSSCGIRSIKLGEKFSFYGCNSGNIASNSNAQAVLPTPSLSVSTGKWIREDGAYGPYTPIGLKFSYDGEAMSGVWVWQDSFFTLSLFPPLDETDSYGGSMEKREYSPIVENQVPYNNYYRFGYRFDHWTDGVYDYENGDVIPANRYDFGEKVVFFAVFEEIDTSVDLVEGMFDLYLTGGSSALLNDIPGNVQYQVYEETPLGWHLVKEGNTSGFVSTGNSCVVFSNVYDPDSVSVQFFGQKKVVNDDGDISYPSESLYEFILRDVTDNVIVQTVSNSDGGLIVFDPIEFDSVCEKIYEIQEISGDVAVMTYDTHVETVCVSVTDNDGILSATVITDDDGVVFVNRHHVVRVPTSDLTLVKQAMDSSFNFYWQVGQVFRFEIKFYNDRHAVPKGEDADCLVAIANERGYHYDVITGIMSVNLTRDVQSVTLSGIPVGLFYEVVELGVE